MNDKEKLKNLYKKCFDEKWDYDNSDIEIGDYCAFCHDTIDRDNDVCCSVDGDRCGDICLIDKDICGSKDSLMIILENLISNGTTDNEKINKAFDNIKEALQKHM